jgi:hypothetical protein
VWIEPGSDEFLDRVQVFARGRDGSLGWRGLERPNPGRRRVDALGNPVRGWGWFERHHHLGASVFSAVGEDGKRHKFISAFDEQEPEQMYFLAQLPDRAKVETYQQAIDALAPPLVHAARKQKRRVYRQGDIFAIETTLDDEQVYAKARTRVRREVALFELDTESVVRIVRGTLETPEPLPEEVQEQGPCPCGCGHDRTIGWGDQARRALMIYGTGHTADEVVVWRNGATYVRGIMHHDPHLEDPSRAREHIDIRLGHPPETLKVGATDRKWYLAVRNTVPRRRRRTTDQTAQARVAEQEEVAV